MRIKKSNGKTKLVMSHKEWEELGKRAGWGDIFKPIIKPIMKAFEPDSTNPYTKEEENGSYQLTGHLEEQQVLQTPGTRINIADLEKMFEAMNTSDADLLLAFPKAFNFAKHATSAINPKVINGLKVVMYRILRLPKDSNARKQAEDVLKKWYKQKIDSERLWEKPTNPYV